MLFNTPADQTHQVPQNLASADRVSQPLNAQGSTSESGQSEFQTFVDNRPEAIVQPRLSDVIHSSPRIVAQRKIQTQIDQSPRMRRQTQRLAEMNGESSTAGVTDRSTVLQRNVQAGRFNIVGEDHYNLITAVGGEGRERDEEVTIAEETYLESFGLNRHDEAAYKLDGDFGDNPELRYLGEIVVLRHDLSEIAELRADDQNDVAMVVSSIREATKRLVDTADPENMADATEKMTEALYEAVGDLRSWRSRSQESLGSKLKRVEQLAESTAAKLGSFCSLDESQYTNINTLTLARSSKMHMAGNLAADAKDPGAWKVGFTHVSDLEDDKFEPSAKYTLTRAEDFDPIIASLVDQAALPVDRSKPPPVDRSKKPPPVGRSEK